MRIITSLLIGLVSGLIGGILIAPKSGKKTRDEILNEMESMRDKMADEYNRSLKHMKTSYNNGLRDYSKRGKKALDQVQKSMKVS